MPFPSKPTPVRVTDHTNDNSYHYPLHDGPCPKCGSVVWWRWELDDTCRIVAEQACWRCAWQPTIHPSPLETIKTYDNSRRTVDRHAKMVTLDFQALVLTRAGAQITDRVLMHWQYNRSESYHHKPGWRLLDSTFQWICSEWPPDKTALKYQLLLPAVLRAMNEAGIEVAETWGFRRFFPLMDRASGPPG